MTDFDFSDLETDVDADGNFRPAQKSTDPKYARQKFECESCNGSGVWAGGLSNRYGNSKCNTCHGKGYLVTSPEARAKAKATKRDAHQAKLDAFQEANPAMFKELAEANAVGHNNEFIASLAYQLFRKGSLSDKQVAAWQRGKDKLAAMKAERQAQREAAAVAVNLAPIALMFATAAASGYKRPMYRANGLRIKPGKGDALYVMTEERKEYGMYGEQPAYEGKIVAGQFHPVQATASDTADKLLAIAADPKGEAIRHGQRTGTCSCCGRELTKHASIEAGIGPICAEKWGL